MLRKIVCEIDVPEDWDYSWDEPTGIQCFSDMVIELISEHNRKELITTKNLENILGDNNSIKCKYANIKTRQSVKIIGHIDSNNNFREVNVKDIFKIKDNV